MLARLSGYLNLSDVETLPRLFAEIEAVRRQIDDLNTFLSDSLNSRTFRLSSRVDASNIQEIKDHATNLHVPLVRLVGGISEIIRNVPDEYSEDDALVEILIEGTMLVVGL